MHKYIVDPEGFGEPMEFELVQFYNGSWGAFQVVNGRLIAGPFRARTIEGAKQQADIHFANAQRAKLEASIRTQPQVPACTIERALEKFRLSISGRVL